MKTRDYLLFVLVMLAACKGVLPADAEFASEHDALTGTDAAGAADSEATPDPDAAVLDSADASDGEVPDLDAVDVQDSGDDTHADAGDTQSGDAVLGDADAQLEDTAGATDAADGQDAGVDATGDGDQLDASDTQPDAVAPQDATSDAPLDVAPETQPDAADTPDSELDAHTDTVAADGDQTDASDAQPDADDTQAGATDAESADLASTDITQDVQADAPDVKSVDADVQDAPDVAPECANDGQCALVKGAAPTCHTWLCQVGTCTSVLASDTSSCSDGLVCTTADACVGGVCVGGPAKNCDDANSCTNDFCAEPVGCAHVATAETAECGPGFGICLNGVCGEPGQPQRIVVAQHHACTVRFDHKVYCWGANDFGELGDNTTTPKAIPTAVKGISDAITVAVADSKSSCARKASGSVVCWGNGSGGQLGDGGNDGSLIPVPVTTLTGVTDLAGGMESFCAVAQGAVWCWGAAMAVDGTWNNTLTPKKILDDAAHVVVGGYWSCGQKTDGSVWCWGMYPSWPGGATFPPVEVPGMNGLTALAGGGNTLCGLKSGAVICVGNVLGGSLPGADNNGYVATATAIPGIATAQSVACGTQFVCVLDQSGSVHCLGLNDQGQIGVGTQSKGEALKLVTLPEAVTEIGCGNAGACATTATGKSWCWGNNGDGQVGFGVNPRKVIPTQVPNLTDVADIAAGYDMTCARKTDNSLLCWGGNDFGLVGDGTYFERAVPTPVQVGGNVLQVSIGQNVACALLAGGAVNCWGNNSAGEVGAGSSKGGIPIPTEVFGLTDATAISVGNDTVCALRTAGNVQCWGSGEKGVLGNGDTANSTIPVDVLGLPATSKIRVGSNAAFAVTSAGLYTWGLNSVGQFGNGTSSMTPNATPQKTLLIPDLLDISGSGPFWCALSSAGTVTCWGESYFVIGNGKYYGNTLFASTPESVPDAVNVISAITNGGNLCVIQPDGTLQCNGYDSDNELADNAWAASTTGKYAMVKIAGLTDVKQCVLGNRHVCALKNDGTVWCWGDGAAGEMGDGTALALSPTPVAF